MIKVKRAACPGVLKDSPSEGAHYRKPEIVHALWEMQHGKCCYCECRIPDNGHGKWVEHFRPQSSYQDQRNDWRNLLLACPGCNGEKLDKFPTDESGTPLIIDPSDPEIDPEDHIAFVVDDGEEDYGLPFEKDRSRLGRTTIDATGLYLSFYVRERQDFYCRVLWRVWIDLLDAERDEEPGALQSAKQRFAVLLSARGRFAAFARAFARHKRADTRFGIRIPVGWEEADAALAPD